MNYLIDLDEKSDELRSHIVRDDIRFPNDGRRVTKCGLFTRSITGRTVKTVRGYLCKKCLSKP